MEAGLEGWSEGAVRFAAFAGIFLLMATLEAALPRRERAGSRIDRWVTNLALSALASFLVRVMTIAAVPIAAIAAAEWAKATGTGLLHWLDWSPWLEFVIALILLDLALYAQHVASHKIPLLWRLHRVHHADVEFDVTTGVRFHPFEIGLSMIYKVAVVIALGADPLAVLVFEIVLNGASLFNHSNLAIPEKLDRVLRLFIVTPDMHRVHHSVIHRETDSNYGFSLSIWDRIFRTYVPQPRDGHTDMKIGLAPHQDDRPRGLLWSLLFPFSSNKRDRANVLDQ
jgi:sterol desaturase/sphingolipid hydroxylase (fatty acid hydroxylase superfamily)